MSCHQESFSNMSCEFSNVLDKLIYSDEVIIEQPDISLTTKSKLIKMSTLLMTNLRGS